MGGLLQLQARDPGSLVQAGTNAKTKSQPDDRPWRAASHQFNQDMFDVSESECTRSDWGEHIDSWDIVEHGISEAECGKYYEGFQCLCRAFFSLGALMGPPHFHCELC